jgi:tetratricopeptide (TPR) repeat protein
MRRYLLIILILYSFNSYSQPEFKVKISDYLWFEIESKAYIDVMIFFDVSNIGNEPDKCQDLYKIKLASTDLQYQYGSDIRFIKISASAEEIIRPSEVNSVSMTFRVPKSADNLVLYFTQDAGGDYKYLTESFNKWIKNNKNYSKFTEEGQQSFSSGDYVSAIVNYYKALLIKPELELNFALGNSWIMLGEYDYAIDCYKESLSEKIDRSIVYNNLGYAYFEKEYYNDAIENFSLAVEYDKNHWDAYLGAAISCYKLYEISDAKELYNYAARIENRLYKGIAGLEILIDEENTFYTIKQLEAINELCKLVGYTSY